MKMKKLILLGLMLMQGAALASVTETYTFVSPYSGMYLTINYQLCTNTPSYYCTGAIYPQTVDEGTTTVSVDTGINDFLTITSVQAYDQNNYMRAQTQFGVAPGCTQDHGCLTLAANSSMTFTLIDDSGQTIIIPSSYPGRLRVR